MAPTVTTARLRATWYVLNTLSFQFLSVALERAKVAAAAAAAAAAEGQLAIEHEASQHLSNTSGDDDGRILRTQQTRQILARLSI
jgi:hypothetical protein